MYAAGQVVASFEVRNVTLVVTGTAYLKSKGRRAGATTTRHLVNADEDAADRLSTGIIEGGLFRHHVPKYQQYVHRFQTSYPHGHHATISPDLGQHSGTSGFNRQGCSTTGERMRPNPWSETLEIAACAFHSAI